MADSATARFVVCRVGGRRFALPVTAVREVCTDVSVVRMPGVAAPVRGVANVRGSVVTVVGAAELLRMESEPAQAVVPWLVVLRYRDGRVGLAVDEVVDLTAIDATVPPIAIDAELDPLFDGAGRTAL